MMIHPQKNDQGQPVAIHKPNMPTAQDTWSDPNAIAAVIPSGSMPEKVGDIAISQWCPETKMKAPWNKLGERKSFDEPPFDTPSHLKRAAGVITVEPDGRVWVVAPTNGFGGYAVTFPKGRVEKGMTLRASAIREAFEESGLQVELNAFLVDVPRSTTFTRYYIARRLGGDPSCMGWESQAVMLVPNAKLIELLTNSNDKPILKALMTYMAS